MTKATLRGKTQDFLAVVALPPVRVGHEGGAAAWLVGTLVVPSVQGTACLCGRSYGPIRVFF